MVRIPNFMFPMLLSSTMATTALAQGELAFGPVTHLRVPVESVQVAADGDSGNARASPGAPDNSTDSVGDGKQPKSVNSQDPVSPPASAPPAKRSTKKRSNEMKP
jgi:hypothetical protein